MKEEHRWMHTNIVVHVARTWERIRVVQPFEEMGKDNIESVDCIVMIADEIFDNDVIQGFVTATEEVKSDDYWIKNTEEGMSDCYIEELAHNMITKYYVN